MNISRISETAHFILTHAETFHLLSSHNDIVNIDTDIGLFSVQKQNIPRTPFAVVMEDSDSYNQFKYELTTNVITSVDECKEALIGQLQSTAIYSSSLSAQNTILIPDLENLALEITMLINKEETLSGLRDFASNITIHKTGLMFHHIEQSDLEKFIRSKLEGVHLSELASPITSLIGLGTGLTPSMDDFLVGLISVFAFFDNHCELSFHRELLELTERNRHTTNRVSESFLQSAVKHQFAQPVLELYDAFESQNLDCIHNALIRILNIGHTSGLDSLNGILFGIKLLTELNQYSYYR